MPQLEIKYYFSSIAYLVIFFSILFFFISSYLLPKINNVINKRKDTIKTFLENITHDKNKVTELIKSYETKIIEHKKYCEKTSQEYLRQYDKKNAQYINMIRQNNIRDLNIHHNKVLQDLHHIKKSRKKIAQDLSILCIQKIRNTY